MPSPGGSTHRRYRLRAYLLVLALVLLLPALGLGAAVSWQAVMAYRHAFEQRLTDTARALALAVDREIGGFTATMTGLATSALLDEGASAANLAEFHARARVIAEAVDSWIVVRGPGPEYRTQVHTRAAPDAPLGAGLQLPQEDAPLPRVFATGRPAVGGIAQGRHSDRPVSFVFVPVIRDGRVIRAIGMALDPVRIARVLEDQGLSGGASAVVVDARGNVAARSRDHERFVARPAPAWFLQAAAGREGGFLRGPGLEGHELVMGFGRTSAAPGWAVVVTEPWAAYAAAWRQPLEALALGGSAIVAVGALLAIGLASRLIRPVTALARDARALAADGAREATAAPSDVTEFEELRLGQAIADAALRARADAKREADARQTLLMREVDHRAKNALMVALAAVRLTARDTRPADFATTVEGRIAALAKAHTLLAESSWTGSGLRALADSELASFGTRVRLTGPPVSLVADAVQPCAMVLHELATNATKHGALGAPDGRVDVTWEPAPEGGLRIDWRERGGPPVPGPPERTGFGTRLIRQIVVHQLEGSIATEWPPEGVRVTITLGPRQVGSARMEVQAQSA